MNPKEFTSSLAQAEPPTGLSVPLAALWWDGKRDRLLVPARWAQVSPSHTLEAEWQALVEALLSGGL
jgi:hypothetical protein